MAPELPSESSEAPAKQAPIIFRLPHQTPDVRLVVFDQEYHVHSTILKLYSNYFRKFLDSTDKPGSSPSSFFKYEYVTVVDDDGIWALESADKLQAIKPDALALLESSGKISVKSECAIFRKLMSAMYLRPYTIDFASDIIGLTRVADFYCALPIVSATLNGPFMSSEYVAKGNIKNRDTTEHIHFKAPELLLAAHKLRHGILFRECLVHIVDFLDDSRRLSQDDRYKGYRLLAQNDVLYRIVRERHNLKCQKIMKVNLEQIKLAQDDDDTVPFVPSAETHAIITHRPDMNARYFRAVRQELAEEKLGGPEEPLMEALDDLLKSDLVLDKTGRRPGEDGVYQHCFHACDADKVVLPWNEEERDW